MRLPTIFLSLFLFIAPITAADETADMEYDDETDRINYSIGYQVGGDLRRQEVEFRPEVFAQGVQDAIAQRTPVMDSVEMLQVLTNIKQKIDKSAQEGRSMLLEKYRGDSAAFLEQNAQENGVVVLPSGIQYRILQEGTGPSPSLDDKIAIHYRGTYMDGQEFTNTRLGDKPAVVSLKNAIPAWQEVLPLMQQGAIWEVVVPPGQSRGPLSEQAVIFEVELLDVQPEVPEHR